MSNLKRGKDRSSRGAQEVDDAITTSVVAEKPCESGVDLEGAVSTSQSRWWRVGLSIARYQREDKINRVEGQPRAIIRLS